ncbi:hypothetical protein FHL15_000694 [Xylaria flabelliformis]|uniref:Uncharacterized protein n=1 Tax=Xylaria flabelliformis TaxID=2512241 RepID=A0A553IEL6_9PEZI|nr:hypothetical protein FHL15_000694 [Xylaria flabelliformis]
MLPTSFAWQFEPPKPADLENHIIAPNRPLERISDGALDSHTRVLGKYQRFHFIALWFRCSYWEFAVENEQAGRLVEHLFTYSIPIQTKGVPSHVFFGSRGFLHLKLSRLVTISVTVIFVHLEFSVNFLAATTHLKLTFSTKYEHRMSETRPSTRQFLPDPDRPTPSIASCHDDRVSFHDRSIYHHGLTQKVEANLSENVLRVKDRMVFGKLIIRVTAIHHVRSTSDGAADAGKHVVPNKMCSTATHTNYGVADIA